ncbi:MAG: hypothetical protein ABFD03_02185 [Clostridiaceae bacterium]
MSSLFLDSFQLIVAVYLLYIAIKGSGTMYRFFDLPEQEQPRVHKLLRTVYLVCGLLALLDAGANMLQNSMFTQQVLESGTTVTQNFTLEGFSFITYDLLSIVSTVLTCVIILALVVTFAYLRSIATKKGKQ